MRKEDLTFQRKFTERAPTSSFNIFCACRSLHSLHALPFSVKRRLSSLTLLTSVLLHGSLGILGDSFLLLLVLTRLGPALVNSNADHIFPTKHQEESNRPLTPILLKSIAIHLPSLSRYFCKSMPSSWQKVGYTPPIRITICLPCVSR